MADKTTFEFTCDSTQFSVSIKKMGEDVSKLGKKTDSMLSGLKKSFATLGSSLKAAGLAIGAGVAAIAGAAVGLKKLADAEKGMVTLQNRVTATTGDQAATAQAFQELESFAKWQKTDDEPLAQSLDKLTLAGMELSDAMGAIKNISIISARDKGLESSLQDILMRAQAGEGVGSRELKQFERQGINIREPLMQAMGLESLEELEEALKDSIPVEYLLSALDEVRAKREAVNEAERQGLDAAEASVQWHFDNMLGQIGASINGSMIEVCGSLTDILARLTPLMQGIGKVIAGGVSWLSDNLKGILGFLTTFGGVVASIFTGVIDLILKAWTELAKIIKDATWGKVDLTIDAYNDKTFAMTSAVWDGVESVIQDLEGAKPSSAEPRYDPKKDPDLQPKKELPKYTPTPSKKDQEDAEKKRREYERNVQKNNLQDQLREARLDGNTMKATNLEIQLHYLDAVDRAKSQGYQGDDIRKRAEQETSLWIREQEQSSKTKVEAPSGWIRGDLASVGGGAAIRLADNIQNSQLICLRELSSTVGRMWDSLQLSNTTLAVVKSR